MSILTKYNYDLGVPGIKFMMNCKKPISVMDFTKSLNSFNHLYSLIAQHEECEIIFPVIKSHDLCIDKIKEEDGDITCYLSEIHPLKNLSFVAVIDSIISFIRSFQEKQEIEIDITIINYLNLHLEEIFDGLESVLQVISTKGDHIWIYHKNVSMTIYSVDKDDTLLCIQKIREIIKKRGDIES